MLEHLNNHVCECDDDSREEEVGLALGVADELEVTVFRAQRLLVLLLRHPQRAAQAGKHRAGKRLHRKVLHTHTAKYPGGSM